MSGLLVAADRALLADGTLSPGWVEVADGLVRATGRGEPPRTPDRRVAVLTPGLVDIHCHGGGGHTFATTDPQEARAAADAHHRAGTTTVLASLVSDTHETLREQVRTLAPLVREGVLGGIHLEGPWLSPLHHGAHDPGVLRDPDPGELQDLLSAGDGTVRMVTLAPERPGGLEAVRLLAEAGVVVAVGHTDVDGDQLRAAVDAGARVVTHLCNAMRPIHHRRPGPVVAALADERLAVELIVDGVHVHDEVVDLIARSARSRLLLVSDAMAAACAPDGRYQLGAMAVDVVDGVARTTDSGRIAGSTLTLDRAVRGTTAAGVDTLAALTAATASPARTLGLTAGVLRPGAPADLVGLDADLHVRWVLRGGDEAGPGTTRTTS